MNRNEIESKLETFFLKKLEIDFKKTDKDINLFDSGYMDSLSFLVITTFISNTFKIKIDMGSVVTQSSSESPFSTFNSIVKFIEDRI